MQHQIKNLTEAAERIKKAAHANERIILYGDSDLDGVASTVILSEAIKNAGGQVFDTMFPDRENDGYGVNVRALKLLEGKAPALFVTLDLGISNVKEVDALNSMGFEVIIVDHHEVLDVAPNASIVVDIKQKDDLYPFKGLCNAGLTFKLAEVMLGPDMSENSRNSFLELVALATISDMVPPIEENKIFIEEGLRSFKNTFRPGLKVFLDMIGVGEVAAGGHLKIISYLNAAESVNFHNDSYVLLTSHDAGVCKDLAESLMGRTQQKQQTIKSIAQEVERRALQGPDTTIIFEGDPAWKLTLAGPVASIIASKYQKPTFIYKRMDHESCGSVRSLKDGESSVEAMKSCQDILITYGGHAKASGFRVKNENLEEFKKRLNQYFVTLRKL